MWPPADVVAAVAPLARVAPEKLHVTLRFLGDAPFDEDALRSIPLPAVVATLGPATATFGRRVLHVPVTGLEALAAALDPRPDRPFVGHLTLARARSRHEDLRAAAGAPVPAAARVPWLVGEVTLVTSAGGRYEVVATFPTA